MKYEAEQFSLPIGLVLTPQVTQHETPQVVLSQETLSQVPVTTTATRGHHKYGASKLPALKTCPGFESRNTASTASDDGTRLHDEMEKVIKELNLASLFVANTDTALSTLGKMIDAGKILVDENERFYLEFCCTELDKYWPKATTVHNEIQVSVLNPDESELTSGYLDLLLCLTQDTGIIFDWKFGWIQVPPAKDNLQGMHYALGCFAKFPRLKKVGVKFVQPKLHQVSSVVYTRDEIPAMYAAIKKTIDDAQSPSKTLRVSPYCNFCVHDGACAAQLKVGAAAVMKYEGVPLPDIFDGTQITTPEQAALAMYLVNRLESMVSGAGIKQKALEFAKNSPDGKISYTLPSGDNVVVEVRSKKFSRTANSPAMIAQAFEPIFGAEHASALVLAACDPSVVKLEEGFAEALVAKQKAAADEILKEAEIAAAAIPDKKQAKEVLAHAKERAKELKVTKKAAGEQMTDMLTSEGLMTREEGTIEFAKVRVEKVGGAEPLQIAA